MGYEPDLQPPGSFPQFDGLIPHNLYSELSELSELTTSSASPSSTAVESGSEEEVELLLLQDTAPATTSRGVLTRSQARAQQAQLQAQQAVKNATQRALE